MPVLFLAFHRPLEHALASAIPACIWPCCFCSVPLACFLSGQTAELARTVTGLLRVVEARSELDERLCVPVPFLADDARWEAGRSATSCTLPAFLGPAQPGAVADAAVRRARSERF